MPADEAAARRARLALSLALGAPATFGGLIVRGPHHPSQRALIAAADAAVVPPTVDETRLSGGLDLAATLACGAPVHTAGVLSTGSAPLALPCAERARPSVVAALAQFLDDTADGVRTARPVIAFDESDPGAGDEALDRRLEDRLAFVVRPQDIASRAPLPLSPGWRAVALAEGAVGALAALSLALGVPSLRHLIAACAAARAIAALEGRDEAHEGDVADAAALVLAPRATQRPAEAPPPEAPPPEAPEEDAAPPDAPPEDAPPQDTPNASSDPPDPPPDPPDENSALGEEAAERLVEAVAAALPPELVFGQGVARRAGGKAGRAGAETAATRGRPAGVRPGRPGRGVRLALTETLTAAAPWRTVRGGGGGARPAAGRIPVRADDLRVRRIKGRAGTLTIFLVDASGSQAYARMAEAKGAVERVLADAYARRDQVALVAFRGEGADVLLSPTPSLTRAKRALAALPAGGGTPLAAGLKAAYEIAERAVREGVTVTLLCLTDARANVALSGAGGREAAREDASALARRVAALSIACVVVDTARRPGEPAKALAAQLRATYAPLPTADAATLSTLARRAASAAPAPAPASA